MCCNHLNRRDFLSLTAGAMAGASLASPSVLAAAGKARWDPDRWDPDRPLVRTGQTLRVQPILMYGTSQKRPTTSYKSWGGIQTEQGASEEVNRIAKELKSLAAAAEFPMQILPVIKIKSAQEAAEARAGDHDVVTIYPATVVFVRHRSGPIYYWYEALSVKYLSTAEELERERVSVYDVVVDDYQELLWRLRALYGVKNFIGARIVALGGPGGKYAPDAPKYAREQHKIEIIEVGYGDLTQRTRSAMADSTTVSRAERWAEQYLSLPNTTLMTDKQFVVNAFLLYGIAKDWMSENNAPAFTIRNCMSTLLPGVSDLELTQ
ncbi:hypothetical protein AMJ85_07520 [candidate division BRC1 bacterium SM23_51]|nr:MAG: hypothetical protein AMJ85_07520 [candidate division BRC1 bacterium SM23_51]